MTNRKASPIPIPAPILTQLDSRDVALWLAGPAEAFDAHEAARLARLPWSAVLAERADEAFVRALESPEPIEDPLVRRRGLVHMIDANPADVRLPPRHLALLLLNGRPGQQREGLAALTRRLTMAEDLRRRAVRQLVVVVAGAFAVPDLLDDLWADGFRSVISFVSDDPAADDAVRQWRSARAGAAAELISAAPEAFADQLSGAFLRNRDGSLAVRMRDEKGATRDVDVARLDDPQRPVLAAYELIGTDALAPIRAEDLVAGEVDGFFADPAASWRPYAAGMAWDRDPTAWPKLRARLGALDRGGVEANRVLFITAEPGSGATTFLRDLAWRAASEGYPTLVARPGPATASGLEMSGFLTRLIGADRSDAEGVRRYEVPCVLVFDEHHWASRHGDLLAFVREIARSGRRVCVVMGMGPLVGMEILTDSRFVRLADLSHRVETSDALALGAHLNRFLEPHGTSRSEAEWRAFYQSSAVNGPGHIAAFWIVLSFWLQRQIDLGETLQSRVYRAFRDELEDPELRPALLRIAAFSTEREPLPDALLPDTEGWPLTARLEDARKSLGVLGLTRVRGEIERYWALVHSLLGRYLINALFYDHPAREAMGYAGATNPEHLRFLLLREISTLPVLQQPQLREVADAFATSMFKIDPDHGHAAFVPFWREVLEALDGMPRSLQATSRTFLHHTAVSRRRIAADPDAFMLSASERVALLDRAARDLEAALRLDPDTGGESDINLYNSLAHALHDLAEAQVAAEMAPEAIRASREAAQEATRHAYSLNPENSFVVETYGRAILAEGATDPRLAASRALEVLALVYGLMDRPGSELRRNALGRLAERAFNLLMEAGGTGDTSTDTELGAIALALSRLGANVVRLQSASLADLPAENRAAAAEALAAPILAGNVQAVKLRYLLLAIASPLDFALQLELLQSLDGSGPAFTPQMRLEMALLMFQRGRAHEGDVQFRQLRTLWRRGEHFVEVPPRLHWLLDASATGQRQVRARVASNAEGRAFARVSEFGGAEVPFRPREFGQTRLAPGSELTAYVSFGHNGPLLRPLTAARR